MSHPKLRTLRTSEDNLVANLRAEVGDIVSTWVLYRAVQAQRFADSSGDLEKDFADPRLAALRLVEEKLRNAMIAQLSELGQRKIGRANFHFAAVKLGRFDSEVDRYAALVERRRLTEKRNLEISHVELPEQWEEHAPFVVPDQSIAKCLGMTLRIMKKIDRHRLGPSSPFLWREVRKKRYELTMPGKIAYMLLPYMRVSDEARSQIVREEESEGRQVWTEMEATVQGRPATLRVAQKWGILDLASVRLLDEAREATQPGCAQEPEDEPD
jgi:hypothetical protein